MRILITSPFLTIGGVASFVNNISPLLGNDCIVFKRGTQIGKGKIRKFFQSFLLPFRFLSCFILRNPQRVIVNTSLSTSLLVRDGLLVALSKMVGKKTLLIIHGFEEKTLRHNILLNWGYFRANTICVLAEEFKQQIISAGYKRDVYVQLNPVSSDILQIEQPMFPPVSKMLYIGRIETAKGIYITIDTYNLLKKNHPEVTLDIVGTGSEYENVVKYIQDNKIEGVKMHGYKSGKEKNDILKSCGCTIFTSYYKEGLPISILEVMAVGQLIISRPVGGIVDLYKQCDFGEMVSSLDAKDFVDSYEKLISDPIKLEIIRKQNMEFAKEHFSPKAIVEKIERIFSEMN